MTTATYLVLAKLAEKVFSVSDLATLGAQTVRQIGNHLVHYTPRADQPLTLDRPIEAFADNPTPANDNKPEGDVAPAPSEPAVALTHARDPSLERAREMPGVQRVLDREAAFYSRFDYFMAQPNNAPKFLSGRSKLKSTYYEEPAPKSVQIASRPLVEEWLAHHPRPKFKSDAAA